VTVVLGTALAELASGLMGVAQSLDDVRIAVVEDHPAGDASVVDELAARIEQASALVVEAHQHAALAAVAADDPASLDEARRPLSRCHALHLAAVEHLVDPRAERADLVVELRRIGARRGPAWASWARVVLAALTDARSRFLGVDRALLAGWDELAATACRSSPGPLPAHSTAPVHRTSTTEETT
jgi:hypothetical protein